MRSIALIDMDCFYAQVEQRDNPELWGKPVAVVQYAREGAYGGIIALSYEAKWAGVKRGMFIPEAKIKCPNLEIAFVPQDPRIIVERASVDEAFLDLTQFCQEIYEEIENKEEYLEDLIKEFGTRFPTTHIADGRDLNTKDAEEYIYDREVNVMEWLNSECRIDPIQYKLAIATATVERIRSDVNKATQFFCSAGIANNKTLAKLVCARHKPRQQSIMAMSSVPIIFEHTTIEDVRMLGGKLGKTIRTAFNINTMGELASLKYNQLVEQFPNQCRWLWNLAKGMDDEPVKPRDNVKSIAASKNFPGKNALSTIVEVTRWVDGLSKELVKRLAADRAKFKRTAENLVITIYNPSVNTKTLKISSYNPQFIYNLAWSYVRIFNKAQASSTSWEPPILHMSFSASKFSEGVPGESKSILQWIEDTIPLKKPEDSHEEEENKPSTSAGISSIVDDDGWQVYDPTLYDKEPVEPEIIKFGDVEIAKDVYNELPESIKTEFENDKRLSEARKRLEEEQKIRASSTTIKPGKSKNKEQRENPTLWGKPVAVVQYSREGSHGAIIALSYEAKWAGVKRGMFMTEAKEKCPTVEFAYVPRGEYADKADIQKYRDASAEVFNVLRNVDPRIIVEKASVDEAFLDMTLYCQEIFEKIKNRDEYLDDLIYEVDTKFPTTHVADGRDLNSDKDEEFIYDRDINLMDWLNISCRSDPIQLILAIATAITEKIRAEIRNTTQFFCSAGIANNKMLTKIACKRHKPRQQTVLAMISVPRIFNHTPIEDVRMMGGKLGKALRETFKISTMADLAGIKYNLLLEKFPNQSNWLWNIAKGMDEDPVRSRDSQSSIAMSKNFPGKNALTTVTSVIRWIDDLTKELVKRLTADKAKHNRAAENLVVFICNPAVQTKTLKIISYHPQAQAPSNAWEPPIQCMSIAASKFSGRPTKESKTILQWVQDYVPINKANEAQTEEKTGGKQETKPRENIVNQPTTIQPIINGIDEEGWEIYDATLFDKTYVAPKVIQLSEEEAAKKAYDELPRSIRSELENERRLIEAKKRLEEEQRTRALSSVKSKKKRSKTIPVQSPPKLTLTQIYRRP